MISHQYLQSKKETHAKDRFHFIWARAKKKLFPKIPTYFILLPKSWTARYKNHKSLGKLSRSISSQKQTSSASLSFLSQLTVFVNSIGPNLSSGWKSPIFLMITFPSSTYHKHKPKSSKKVWHLGAPATQCKGSSEWQVTRLQMSGRIELRQWFGTCIKNSLSGHKLNQNAWCMQILCLYLDSLFSFAFCSHPSLTLIHTNCFQNLFRSFPFQGTMAMKSLKQMLKLMTCEWGKPPTLLFQFNPPPSSTHPIHLFSFATFRHLPNW